MNGLRCGNGSAYRSSPAWRLRAVARAAWGAGPGLVRPLLLVLLAAALSFSSAMTMGAEVRRPADVPSAYRETARLYGIPPVLFYAMALQESGRTVRNAHRPWPWTLNVEGESYYYDTQTQMWDALRGFVMAGRTHIGIGLLQVTTPYNGHVLSDLYAAIDPYTNLRMGAQILLERYRETGDWWIAVGHYHSPGRKPPQIERARHYRESVQRRWRKLYGPLADGLEQEVWSWASIDTP